MTHDDDYCASEPCAWLDNIVATTNHTLAQTIDRELADSPPNFADVIARVARQSQVENTSVHTTKTFREQARLQAGADAALDAMVTAAISSADADTPRVIPMLREPTLRKAPPPRQKTRFYLAAAAAIAFIGLPTLAWQTGNLSHLATDSDAALASPHQAPAFDETDIATTRDANRRMARSAATDAAADPATDTTIGLETGTAADADAELDDALEMVDAPDAAEQAIVNPPKTRSNKPRSARLSHDDAMLQLERDAETRWRARELDRATAAFREIIRRDRRGKYGQTAYGNLFLLARDRGEVSQQRALWLEYLRAFPKGRFADDASAGLCRTDAESAATCWQDYLRRFPDGAHRKRAMKGSDTP